MTSTLQALQARYPGSKTFRCGNTAEMSARLLGLMRCGAKTATCMPLADVESGKEAMPLIGRCDIALNWDGTPALVIETLALEQVRFYDVTSDFALSEGENDTLEGWREDHRAYFESEGGFAPEMVLICERFRVVEDVGK